MLCEQVARIRPFMPLAATIVVVLIVGSMIACNATIVGQFGPMVGWFGPTPSFQPGS
jgi:hypothetical protein